jgi:hypothetical protein
MGSNGILRSLTGRAAARSLLACIGAAAILFTAALATAQESDRSNGRGLANTPGFFSSIMHWFGEQSSNLGSNLRGARSGVENFGHEAGIAAKTTVEGARDAAGVVGRIPTARVMSGHEKCLIAPNGAPDCVAAATAICKSKGYASGSSVDMTTAEICPPEVYLAGKTSGPSCRTETYVSRALCQ